MLRPPAGQVQAPVLLLMAAQGPHMLDIELGSASACAAHVLFSGQSLSRQQSEVERSAAPGDWELGFCSCRSRDGQVDFHFSKHP